ncbi:MAG: ABC transporter permease [Thermoflexales bacterium]|nr:ABC transporter permease [Thermoflexales bacterium]
MAYRIINLTVKELIQLLRDRLMMAFIILAPVLELVLLAHSTGQGIQGQPAVVVDHDRSQLSRQIVTAIDNTDELDVLAYLDSSDQVEAWFRRDRALLAVILPLGLEADMAALHTIPQVQVLVDGANSVVASNALSAASGAINALLARRISLSAQQASLFALSPQVRYNPTFNIRYFTITAQLGFIIYQVALMVASLGLARERELGTLEQLLVTPLQRMELIIGKAIPALVIAGLDFVLMWAITVWGFGVPMRGSFGLLLGLSLLFIVAESGWGLTISATSRTQQQAVLMVFVLAMIDIAFSGYLVPVDRMPRVLQMLSYLFPLQHYLTILRQVMLKGAGLEAVWGEVGALVALGIASATVAAFSLRRQLD